MKLCGIDEAGRGCIIGPLVLCGAMIDADGEDSLAQLGVKDSKLLSIFKRNQLFEKLTADLTYQVIIVPPAEIDKYVLSANGQNLNWLEAEKTVELIDMLSPDKAILDSPSPNLKAYKSYVDERLLNKNITLQVEHKADANNPIVAAASIIAKVTRDREIEKIKQSVGEDFGSGYMSDPRTQVFLERNWETYSRLFRHSWAPYRHIVAKNFQKGLDEF